MDAEVYWNGRLVGYLRNLVIDQPHYHGDWSSCGDAGFERAYRVLQAEIAPDGLGVLPVTFRSPDGTLSAPAAALVRHPELEPYFRFGAADLEARVVCQPAGKTGDDLASWHKWREANELHAERQKATDSDG